MMHTSLIAVTAMVGAMLACSLGTESPTEAPILVPSSAPSLAVGPTRTLPSTLTSTTLPNFTATTAPARTSTPTLVPSATHTPLPTLPSFSEFLTLAIGGGGMSSCQAPMFAPPGIYGFRCDDAAPHLAAISVAQRPIPVLAAVHVRISSPDGSYSLDGTFHIVPFRGADDNLHGNAYWLSSARMNGKSSYADDCTSTSCSYLNLQMFWPVGVPQGIWRLSLSWEGGGISGDFDANTKLSSPLSELAATDSLSGRTLRGMTEFKACHEIASRDELVVSGLNFQPNASLYLVSYEYTSAQSGHRNYRLFGTQSVTSDASGAVTGRLDGAFQSGRPYELIGVVDAALPYINSSGMFDQAVIGNNADCFYLVDGSSASCPGAPPQRMLLGERGRVCTKSDPVYLRSEPSRSAGVIRELSPGTQFTVIEGAPCANNWSWWEVRLEDGTGAYGWIAEGGDAVDPYFICPLR